MTGVFVFDDCVLMCMCLVVMCVADACYCCVLVKFVDVFVVFDTDVFSAMCVSDVLLVMCE